MGASGLAGFWLPAAQGQRQEDDLLQSHAQWLDFDVLVQPVGIVAARQPDGDGGQPA